MKNSVQDFIFGDGNTMNRMFRQFSMGAVAMAIMQVANAQVSVTNIVPMQIPGQGTEIRVMFNGKGQTDIIRQSFGYYNFPVISKIPVIGQIFFTKTSLPAYVGILLAIVAWFVVFKTSFGLRLRSVGEHPQAADTLGINVYKMRYAGVLLSGFFGGMGGAVLAQSISLDFSVSTVAGQGFMAMAAMIFGKWNPLGAMGAALFFGFAQSLAVIGGQIPYINSIPSVFLQVAPYIITIIVLVGFVGNSRGPAANGTTYVKSK